MSSILTIFTSVSNNDGTLTISPTVGAIVAKLNLNHANIWNAIQTFGNNISLGGAPFNVGTLANKDLIQYDAVSQTWVNAQLSSFGVASVSNTDGSLTISPTTGSVIASLNRGNANIWTAIQTFNSNILMANNVAIRWKDSGGTARNILNLDGSNNVQIAGTGITYIVANQPIAFTAAVGSVPGVQFFNDNTPGAEDLFYQSIATQPESVFNIVPPTGSSRAGLNVWRSYTKGDNTTSERIQLGTDLGGIPQFDLLTVTGTSGTARPLVFSMGASNNGPVTEAFRITITPTVNFAVTVNFAATAAFTNSSPFSVANGQTLTLSVTAQTMGAATLTIPNFAGVSDTFAFTTLAQTLNNKTMASPTFSGTIGGAYTIGGTPSLGASLGMSADASWSLGTATNRILQASFSSNVRIFAVSADANASTSLESGVLKLGVGGATALRYSFAYGTNVVNSQASVILSSLTGANSWFQISAGTNPVAAFILARLTGANYEVIELGSDTTNVGEFSENILNGGTGSLRPRVWYMNSVEAIRITTAPVVKISSSLAYNVTALSGNTTLVAGTHQVVLDNSGGAANTITLPAANAQTGLHIIVVKTDSSVNVVTVAAAGADTIEGAASVSLTTQYKKVHLMSDGISKWYDLGAGLI